MTQKTSFIKRWSKAESFTIFENHEYTSKKNLTFAINFVATPFLGESCFSYATQAKVRNKFCGNSIFGRKFVFLMQHRQKIAINFVTTPFLVEGLY